MKTAHLPTSAVQIDELLRVAIRELGVRPLREDWGQILDALRIPFEQASR